MATIQIYGSLREKDTQRPMPGMYVEIYGSGTPANQQFWMGGGKSNEDGAFSVFLREDTYPLPVTPSLSDPLTLVVFYGDHVIHTQNITSTSVNIQVPTQHYNFYYYYYYGNNGTPIDPTHERSEDLFFIIEGNVTNLHGQSLSGILLNAHVKGYHSSPIVCRAYTDSNGYYSMKIARMSLNGFQGMSIKMQASPHASSPDIFDFPLRQTVDLQIDYYADYEYSDIYYKIADLTTIYYVYQIAGITIEGEQRESRIIARAIGKEETSVIALIQAWRLAIQNGWVYPYYNIWEAADDPYAQYLYCLIMSSNTDDPGIIFSIDSARMVAIWRDAINKNVIDAYIEYYLPMERESETEPPYPVATEIFNALQSSIALDSEIEGAGITMADYYLGLAGGTAIQEYFDYLSTYEGNNVVQFWSDFEAFLGEDSWMAYDLQKRFQIAAITGYQINMSDAVYSSVGWNITDVVAWDEAAWISMIGTAGGLSAVPQVIKDNSSDPIADYAERLKFVSQDMYPGGTISWRLQNDAASLIPDGPTRTQVSLFLINNPEFDFRTRSVEDINEENYSLGYISDINAVREALIPFQTISRIANAKNDAVVAMMLNGLNSAAAIVSLSQDTFVAGYSSLLGGAQNTAAAYHTAVKLNAASLHAATDLSLIFNGPTWIWSERAADPAVANPDLATLFGSLEQCSCSECMSVYSAGAYYVDILNFIKQKGYGNTQYDKPYQELRRRRPDLLHIDITCKNANTALPYIDLLNERLEVLIMQAESISGAPNSYQTTGTAANLAAYPEHMYRVSGDTYAEATAYEGVYNNVLKNALYPLSIPLNLPLEETRVYLQHLGYSRLRLMDMFRAMGGSIPATGITYYNYFTESAGMSKETADIISKLRTADAYRFYGFTGEHPKFLSPTDNSIINGNELGTWQSLLKGDLAGGGLDVLLYVLDISFADLRRLLYTDVLNKPVSGVRRVKIVPEDICVLRELKLEITGGGVVNTFFDELHRFVRLWKATGIGIYELDVLLRAFGVEDISNTNDQFENMMRAIHLARKLNIPVECFATWWAVIDTYHYLNYNSDRQEPLPSVYDRFFRSKSNPKDTTFDLSELTTKTYDNHMSGIIAACRISEEDLKLLMGALSINAAHNMSLEGLTKIFGVATVCNALKIKAQDFIRFCTLCEIVYGQVTVTPTVSHAATQMGRLEKLIRYAEMLGSSGFSLNDVRYLILNKDEQQLYIQEEKVIQPFYEAVRAELQKNYVDPATVDPEDDEYAQKIQALKDALKNIVIQHFTAQFNLQADSALFLLQGLFKIGYDETGSGSYADQAVLDALIDPDFIFSEYDLSKAGIAQAMVPPPPPPPVIPWPHIYLKDLYPLYYRMHKMALLFTLSGVRKEEIRLLQEYCGDLDVPDLTSYPYEGNEIIADTEETFLFLMRYVRWVTVRKRLALTPEQMRQLAETILTGTKEEWFDVVETITQWEEKQIEALVGPENNDARGGILQAEYNDDFIDPGILLRMADIFAASAKIGLLPQQINGILQSNLLMADARRVRMAARSKYDEATWMKVAKPLQDPLREKQRQAMVAYLLTKPDKDNGKVWRTENDLYAWLLMDVEMQPCTMTSRIRLALSSVQLYVQRVIMNLEYYNQGNTHLVKLTPSDIAQWKSWRKWYRIWEANRKVFLYPENWIEPELRDNKTPFFKDLETQLLQDELNETTATNAYLVYLEKLDEVARLEPVASYHEVETAGGPSLVDYLQPSLDVFHVIARTYKEPHIYYYRKRIDGEWTAWEPMNIEPKSDHMTLVVWNRRLIVLWLDFMEQQFSDGLGDSYIRNMKWQEWGKPIMSSRKKWNDRPGATPLPPPPPTNALEVVQRVGYAGQFPVWWMKTGEAYDLYSELRDNNMSIESAQNKLLKGWRIRVNWSEYNNGRWSPNKKGTDEMMMYPWAVGLTRDAYDSLEAASVENLTRISDQLRNKNELSINELFKNRLSLQPIISGSDGSLILSIMFTPAPNEVANSIYAFKFDYPGANPVVVREITNRIPDIGSMVSPDGTMINKTKFEKSVFSNGRLSVSEYDTIPGKLRFYWGLKWMQSGYSDFFPKRNNTILGQTPNGRFTITTKANKYGRNPVYDQFFFEDNKNLLFFYRNTSLISMTTSANAVMAQTVMTSSAAVQTSYQFAYVAPFTSQVSSTGNTATVTFTTAAAAHFSVVNPVYYVRTFYHAHVNKFIRELNLYGIDGLLNLRMQVQTDSMNFWGSYAPSGLVHSPYPTNKVAFDYDDAYSVYNWELFYHIPMLIAQRLSENQQFEQAQKWYHYVFDPTNNTDAAGNISTTKQRFWKCRPLYDQAGEKIETLTDMMAHINQYSAQVTKWEKHPFSPHVIARMRLLAYMKNTVMKYLDNLIAWGDQLFRRDTIESLNEATQLYILASNILGKKPESISPVNLPPVKSFFQLSEDGLDRFSNAVVKIERYANSGNFPVGDGSGEVPKMFYFCLPQNDKLMGYWDTVADRLFKIRNCMNIEGVVRQLPLFDPPIDPAMLVRAAAAGIDPGAVLDSIAGIGMPHYRFSYIVQKANEICADVKALGAALLAALEKKDAEHIAVMRSGYEIKLLEQVKTIREAQVQEAEQTIEALKKTREVTEVRYRYYSTRTKMNSGEEQHLKSLEEGIALQARQAIMEGIAGTIAAIPNFHIQGTASGTSIGGANFATITRAAASVLGIEAMTNTVKGTMAQTKAGYERRQDDWDFQAESALKELEQIDKQIIGAEIRLSIAQKELDSQTLQIENNREVDAYMRSKYTNEELYQWMITQIATVYFQSYQLAFDIAKKAEMCFKQELPEPLYKMPSKGLIQFGYWDSLRKGLMSGEKLQYDLRKMEATYTENNKRQLELTKHVSLVFLDPQALLRLRNDGVCDIDIPEVLFDLDYPGHYMRRIKSVSISIPCVAGPYTTVSCMLFQTSSKYRWNGTMPESTSAYPETGDNDPRFKKFTGGDSVATSSAQNDSGVFELNFRDERYLPFEGSGAISNWTLLMPNKNRQFDYDTIQDVIIHIKYTAEYNGALKDTVESYTESLLADPDKNYPAYFSLKHQFPDAWAAGMSQQVAVPITTEPTEPPVVVPAGQARPILIPLSRTLYPEYAQKKEIEINKLTFILKPGPLVSADVIFYLRINGASETVRLGSTTYSNGRSVTIELPENTDPVNLNLAFYKRLTEVASEVVPVNPADVQDLFMITTYTLADM